MSQVTVRCAPDDTVREACRRMAENRCGHVLVCDGERLVGIFTERDLLMRVVAAGHDPARYPVEKAMTVNPVTIEADAPIREAIRVMDEGSFRCLPVMEGGKLIGILTARDLPYEEIGRMARMLEEEHIFAERLW
jgi:CBS domain-containing protein